MKQTIKFQRVSLLRRICSIIFDLIICLSATVLIQSFIVQPIFKETTDYYEKYEKYCEMMEDTGLYLYYEEVDGVSIINTKYDEHLTNFYNEENTYAKALGYNEETYLEIKKENSDNNPNRDPLKEPIFLYVEKQGTYVYVENIYDLGLENKINFNSEGNITNTIDESKQNKVNLFYSELVYKLVEEIQTIEEVEGVLMEVTAYTLLFWISSFIPSVLVFYLVLPMVFKDRTTLGKKLLQMRVIDSVTGKNASRFQTFMRFTFFALLQIALGIMSFGLIPLISVVMIFISKKRQTIHDMISKTMVISSAPIAENVNEKELIVITYDNGEKEGENKNEK